MAENEHDTRQAVCPNCGHGRTDGEECPNCGIIYRRFEERAARRSLEARRAEAEAESGGSGGRLLLGALLLIGATAGLTYYFTAGKTPPAPAPSGPPAVERREAPPPGPPATADVGPGAPASPDAFGGGEAELLPTEVKAGTIEQAKNATVSVATPWGQGAGFFISGTCIVTNRHVVEADEEALRKRQDDLKAGRDLAEQEAERQRLLRRRLAEAPDSEEKRYLSRRLKDDEVKLKEFSAKLEEEEEAIRLRDRPLSHEDITIRFADGREERPLGLKLSERHDLALLFTALPNRDVLAPAKEHERLRQGDRVIAIGNPSGLSHTVTSGVFSGYRRLKDHDDEVMLQTDASINPGNSGGPLLDEKGRVHGVNTMKVANARGLGFAIPIKTVLEDFGLAVEEP